MATVLARLGLQLSGLILQWPQRGMVLAAAPVDLAWQNEATDALGPPERRVRGDVIQSGSFAQVLRSGEVRERFTRVPSCNFVSPVPGLIRKVVPGAVGGVIL